MLEWIINTVDSLGYWGVALLMLLENIFPPIPSELIMPLAGFTVAQGKMAFIPVVLAGTIGTVVGALLWYYIGKCFSEQRLKNLADKYGKWLTISSKDIRKANYWFKKQGYKAVFFCRLVPGVRTLISLPAGMNDMPIIFFIIYSSLGTALWVTLLTTLGFILGEQYYLVETYLAPVSKIVIVSIIIWFIIWWARKKFGHHY